MYISALKLWTDFCNVANERFHIEYFGVLGSSLGRDTDHASWGFRWFSSVFPDNYFDIAPLLSKPLEPK
jgi:hypothetical protein